MSEPVTPNAGENQNQPAADTVKPDGQPVVPPVADPAPVVPPVDSSTPPVIEPPKADPIADAPVAFEIKKADGSLVDAAEAEKIVSFSKEHGLSPAQAQALYARENAAKSAFDADVEEQYNQRKIEWIESGKKDPVLGGEHYAQNVQAAHLKLQEFASPEFMKMLDETGFGNHPEVLKVFFNLHLAHKDDVAVRSGEPPSALKSTADVMYGQPNK